MSWDKTKPLAFQRKAINKKQQTWIILGAIASIEKNTSMASHVVQPRLSTLDPLCIAVPMELILPLQRQLQALTKRAVVRRDQS